MDNKVIDNIVEFVLKPDETISDIKTFHSLEGDYVATYVQDGQKKLLTITYLEN